MSVMPGLRIPGVRPQDVPPRVAGPLPAALSGAGGIRLITFTLLAAFSASAWGTNLLSPSGAGRCILMALIAAAFAAVLLALGSVEHGVARHVAAALATLLALG